MSDHIAGDPPPTSTADQFVPITLQVHIDDLASFYAALATWAETADGARGRTRVA
jgi:hypothetical protein